MRVFRMGETWLSARRAVWVEKGTAGWRSESRKPPGRWEEIVSGAEMEERVAFDEGGESFFIVPGERREFLWQKVESSLPIAAFSSVDR